MGIGRGFARIGLVLACLVLPGLLPSTAASEAAFAQPGRISATYDAGVAAINLGTFEVKATFAGTDYDLTAKGRFSILAGLVYKATGTSTSRGTLNGAELQPAEFTLAYDDTKKRQKLNMTFADGTVRKVSRVPKKKPDRRAVPIPADQLSNVLDPLTAAFLSVRSDVAPGDLGVCNQTIRVFDGKQRFNLQLSPKRTEALGSRVPKKISKRAAVCRVRYEPIGGYRPEHPGVKFLMKAEGIEAWLVTVPGTGLYLPYKIVVPTTWGNGKATLTGLKTTTAKARAR